MRKNILIESSGRLFLCQALSRMNFFSAIGQLDFDRFVDCFSLYEFQKNDVVFDQGESAEGLYVVYHGKISVTRLSLFIIKRVCAHLGPGEFFGEMAYLFEKPRNATIRCETVTQLFCLQAKSLSDLFEQNPTFRDSLKELAASRSFTPLWSI